MTFIGKVLTILVFVMSLMFLGFAVAVNRLNKDPLSKKSWYEVAEMRRKEVQNAHADIRIRDDDLVKRQTEITSCKQQLQSVREEGERKLAFEQNRAKKAEDEAQNAKKQFEDSQNAVKTAAIESENRRKDVERLNGELKKKDLAIADLQTNVTKSTNTRIQAEVESKSLKDRLQTVVREYEQLVRATQTADAATPTGKTGEERLALKPPPEDVKGIITEISPDGGLIQISIGSDDGVDRGHTLEIMRLEPKPEYLGRIQIVEAKSDQAVGKLLTPQFKKKIRKNDLVVSNILSNMP